MNYLLNLCKQMKLIFIVVALVLSGPIVAFANEPIPVVATFSILGDMVERIGGDSVSVTTLVGRDGDTHVYEPTPADARAVKEAAILFVNGLDFEGWLSRLSEAAAFSGDTIVATTGIKLIAFEEHHETDEHTDNDEHADDKDADEHTSDKDQHADDNDEHADEHHDAHDHGEFDPHGWQSLSNAVTYIDNITSALARSRPDSATTFYKNRETYVAEIEALDEQIHAMFAALPEHARSIVTSHDAFQYFGREYGLNFLAPQGLSTESEASAHDVAGLIKQMRAESISAVFVENVADPRLLKQIANETGAAIGGKLYPGSLSSTNGPAASYLDLMRHNAKTIATALVPQ